MAVYGTPRTIGRVLPGTKVSRRPAGGTPPEDTTTTTPAPTYGMPVDRIERVVSEVGAGTNVDTSGESLNINIADLFKDMSTATAGGTSASSRIAREKFDASKIGAQRQAEYLRGLLGQGVPEGIRRSIESQKSTGEAAIGNRVRELLAALGTAKGAATGQVTGAYTTLANYLAQNAPTAYAEAERARPNTYQTALGQYMSGQGVSPEVAQRAAQLASVESGGGAANYNQLLNTLAAREASMQQSRLAEAEMARTGALGGLENLYRQREAQVEMDRLAALNELATRINAATLAAEQQVASRERAIQDALGQLLGGGFVAPEVVNPPAPLPGTPLEQLAALTRNAPTRNPALAQRVSTFTQQNPQATAAQIQNEFSRLGRRIR